MDWRCAMGLTFVGTQRRLHKTLNPELIREFKLKILDIELSIL